MSNAAIQALVWEVAALVQAVGDALAARFGAVAVRGELASFTRAASGHCYFTLKDARGDAALRCAMFRRAAGLLDFAPAEGQLVELRGRLTVYEARGELQMVVESMQRAGAGQLMEQFLRLKARLEAEGLFDADRKRALPRFPRRVGVVTSLAAAALRDVTSAFARRAPHVELRIYPAPVQGADAPLALVAALQLAARRAEVDLLIVCRGGGSLEDLWAFNDERVVRAVAASPIPVVSGVGHETDFTLTDFAADLRAPTPTAAAELAAPAREDCLIALSTLARRLQARMHQRLDQQVQRLDQAALRLLRPSHALQYQHLRLDALARRRAQAMPARLREQADALARLTARLRAAGRVGLERSTRRHEVLAARLAALDPARTLSRGYAWVTDADGAPVLGAAAVRAGQVLTTQWADGQADSHVEAVRTAPLDAAARDRPPEP